MLMEEGLVSAMRQGEGGKSGRRYVSGRGDTSGWGAASESYRAR
jgi:hypothetical protein